MTTDLAAQHTARAALWIGILLRQFPELLEELAPGRTGRPGATSGPAAALHTRVDRADALWNEQHGLTVLGAAAAPVQLHISDAIRDITDGVVELEEAVREKLRLTRPTRAAVPERLRRITALLDHVADHPVLARHVLDESRRMARRCGSALGDAETLIRIGGRCPWCDSVSLRAFPSWRSVLCVNPGCRCPEPDCGCSRNPAHRHSWPETAWGQLGLDTDEITALIDDEVA